MLKTLTISGTPPPFLMTSDDGSQGDLEEMMILQDLPSNLNSATAASSLSLFLETS